MAVAVALSAPLAVAVAPPAQAAPPGCVDQLWITWDATRRTICDGPRQADGSWTRWREFYTPAHNVPFTCNTYGGYYSSSTSCSGGYFVPRSSLGVEDYPVTDATVLHDEPGWIA